VLIYSHNITPRLQYIAGFLSDYYQHSFEITTAREAFEQAPAPKINYTTTSVHENEIRIHPESLLFEKGITGKDTACFKHHKGFAAIFPAPGDMEFDLFAAIFYLITRYEEYLPHQKDEYGRYDHRQSVAFRDGFLQQPLVNIWLQEFSRLVKEKTGFSLPVPLFQWIPTYDIDIAWSYKNKGWLRNTGGWIRDLIKGNSWALSKRIEVVMGLSKDPFDVYAWLDALHHKYDWQPYYFFHMGFSRNQYDKSIGNHNKAFRQLVHHHGMRYQTGLHPSWQSGNDPQWITKEKEELEAITAQPVVSSRQHYIRFTLPETYRHLLDCGLHEDWSMGYGGINGFRASIAHSFYWYDLENDQQTSLLLHPFCFMDANSFFEQHQTAEQSFEEICYYYQTVKEVSGTCIAIWHPNFFGTDPLYKGWKEVYERLAQLTSVS
jgi:hypothetical protein